MEAQERGEVLEIDKHKERKTKYKYQEMTKVRKVDFKAFYHHHSIFPNISIYIHVFFFSSIKVCKKYTTK